MNIETILSRPSVRGFEFRLGLDAFAHKVGAALSLPSVTVTWSLETQTAGINAGGELYLANVRDDATVSRALVLKYAAYVVHELLHHSYTDFKANAETQYVRTLHNAVEDGWIENKAIKVKLLGNIGPLLGEMIDTMTTKAIAEVADWNDPRQYPFILAVHCRQHATIKCPTNPRLTPIFDEAAKRCLLANSSHDTLRIAEWVYEQIKQANKNPEPKKKPKKEGKKEGKDDRTPETGDKGPTSPDKGEGEGKAKGDVPSAPDAPVGNPDDGYAVEVEPSLELGEPGGRATFSKGSIVPPTRHLRGGYVGDLVNVTTPAKLRYEVKRLFDNSGLTEFTRNRKAGVVNVHALPTVATGGERVFKRRLDVEGVDSAVVICLDVSGSMFTDSDSRPALIKSAVLTCRALLETLSAADVSVAVITFGDKVAVAKPFNQSHRIASAALGNAAPAGGTNDYAALRYAHEILIKRPESRKIAFVLTDGRGRPDAVRAQDASGRNLGITTIGIGIRSDVADVYGQAVRVDDVADLASTSLKQIKLAA